MTELDHSAVGELLRAYVEGTLESPMAQAVARHLNSCGECRREEAGLRALLAPVDELSAAERSHLRAAISAALPPQETRSAQVITLRRPWLSRLAPAMGAAALLGIVVVALTQIDFTPRSGEDTAAGIQSEQSEAEAPAAGAAEALDAQVVPLQPVFDRRAGTLALAELKRLGKSGFIVDEPDRNKAISASAGSESRAVEDAASLGDLDAFREPMLFELSNQAGESDIASCAKSVFGGGYARIAPVYGAFGKFQQDRVLILGFLWSNNTSGPLNNYAIWIWPRNSCGIALQSLSGPLRK